MNFDLQEKLLTVNRLFIMLTSVLFMQGCRCDDQIIESNLLSDFEKTFIPYTTYRELSFIDDEGNTSLVVVRPKENKIETRRTGAESCNLIEYEKEVSTVQFLYRSFSISLELLANNFNLRSLSELSNINGVFSLSCEGQFNVPIQENVTNITVNQFEFQNVLVFYDCSNTTEIEMIIYSIINGIEFIEFTDGKWIKLNE